MTLKINVTINPHSKEALKEVKELCRKSIPGCNGLELDVTPMNEGLTNILFRVYLKKDKEIIESVVVRVSGSGSELLINREKEVKLLEQMQKYGKGPKLYAIFNNGSVVQYFHGKAMSFEELKEEKHLKHIAREMASYHKLQIGDDEDEPRVVHNTTKWYNVVKNIKFDDEKKMRRLEELKVPSLQKEIDQMFEIAKDFEMGFSHNDLTALNIIYNEKTGEHNFIDFEYAGLNYRAFDIGNFFCECCGYDSLTEYYPNEEQQKEYIKSYLETFHEREVTESEIHEMRVKANVCCLLSNLHWGVWGLYQAKFSDIDYDFFTYGEKRLQWYWDWKENILSMMKK